MLNRKLPPFIHKIPRPALPRPTRILLDNRIPVYILDYPDQEVVKVECLFRAGRPQETKRLTARATTQMMREGAGGRSSADIAELVDFYGGSLYIPNALDHSSFTLYSLKKYAGELIPVLSDVVHSPDFPEKELDTFKRTGIQDLQVDLEKVEVLAYRIATEKIFGENHPYGYNSTAADYQNLSIQDLQSFFQQWYTPANCTIIAGGRVDDEILRLLNKHFGQTPFLGHKPDIQLLPTEAKPETIRIKKPDSLQTAIKIGRRSFNRIHPDSNGFAIVTAILGGYFGSRLMTNIREKKGFTYNIYATNDQYRHDGCFYIATEVNRDNVAKTQRAIFREMKRLREEPISDEELEMVKNYLLGMLLNGLDGAMNTTDVVKGMIADELPWEVYDTLTQTIRDIRAEEIQALAERYFQPEDFWTVMVG